MYLSKEAFKLETLRKTVFNKLARGFLFDELYKDVTTVKGVKAPILFLELAWTEIICFNWPEGQKTPDQKMFCWFVNVNLA